MWQIDCINDASYSPSLEVSSGADSGFGHVTCFDQWDVSGTEMSKALNMFAQLSHPFDEKNISQIAVVTSSRLIRVNYHLKLNPN